ncbi:zinc finger and BTB domain-containing protein 41-like [Ceratina calcarata]|uniref:Zinc finger and BTB domain-containing protein 41-like n=1 Tax=Ceratina calcarata TaxID=156304 RepID=A0AAJ7JB16_9HYME|nr:zinc finger and BTB domain-containing protein 41-like [Ceratina calcarata]
MNAHRNRKNSPSDATSGEAMKYNLRCNRNISEKMTKKDFVYDIRPPLQSSRKLEEGKYPIVLPLQLRRKQGDSKMPQYTVISEKSSGNENSEATNVSQRPLLRFECNFCHEQIATLLSLSTHIKFHRRKYCKYCYWILLENETMEEHVKNVHRTDLKIAA